MLLQKLRHLTEARPAVYIMGGVLPVLMKHYHVGNGKAVSLKVFRVVDIETLKNALYAHAAFKGRGVNIGVVRRINGKSRRL